MIQSPMTLRLRPPCSSWAIICPSALEHLVLSIDPNQADGSTLQRVSSDVQTLSDYGPLAAHPASPASVAGVTTVSASALCTMRYLYCYWRCQHQCYQCQCYQYQSQQRARVGWAIADTAGICITKAKNRPLAAGKPWLISYQICPSRHTI